MDDIDKKERILKDKLRMFAEEVKKDLNDCINQYHEVNYRNNKLVLKTKLEKMMNFNISKIDGIFEDKVISKAKFIAYMTIQKSGLTNMLDYSEVARLIKQTFYVREYTNKDHIYIIEHYGELKEEYLEEWKKIFKEEK